MAASLAASLGLSIVAVNARDDTQAQLLVQESQTLDFGNGVLADLADVLAAFGANDADEITVAVGTPKTINLHSFAAENLGVGTGRDNLGTVISAAKMTGLLLFLLSGDTLTIGGEGSANAFSSLFGASNTGVLTLKAPGFLGIGTTQLAAWGIGSSSNNLLKFTASGSSCVFKLFFLGRSS